MSNDRLVFRYFLPYFVYVGVAALPLDPVLNYTLRILLTGAALLWAARGYRGIRGPRTPLISVAAGVAVGLLGILLWIALVRPFAGAGEGWSDGAWWLRMLAATLLVPLFEEMALRGFVLRFLVQWQRHKQEAWESHSVGDLEPGGWTWTAVLLSSLAFALGHGTAEMPAAFAYGMLMALLWIWRRDLLSCIVAHATTNLALALHVRASGEWGLW